MGRNARIALAVGIGYLLGRRRRLRSALVLGAAAAAGRMSTDPQALRRLLPAGSELGGVAGLGKPLAAASKAAATAAVSHGIDSVGDRMRRRADALRGAGEAGPSDAGKRGRGAERDWGEAEPEDEYGGAEPEDEYGSGEAERGEEEHDDDAQDEPKPRPKPEPRRRAKAAARPAARRPRQRAAEDDGDEAAEPSRRGSRGRTDPNGAPVRRRGR